MKKFIYLFVALITITGCSCAMGNTPTKKVEEFLNKYQMNDSDVVSDLDDVLINDTALTVSEREDYTDFMKKHYSDLKYEIKDETIDGENATVKAAITVRSYADAINKANKYRLNNADEFNDNNTFASYRLEKLKEVDKTETYTINFKLNKKNNEWKLENLSDEDLNKINGVYGVTDVNTIDTTDNNETNDDITDDTNDNITDDTTTAP